MTRAIPTMLAKFNEVLTIYKTLMSKLKINLFKDKYRTFRNQRFQNILFEGTRHLISLLTVAVRYLY